MSRRMIAGVVFVTFAILGTAVARAQGQSTEGTMARHAWTAVLSAHDTDSGRVLFQATASPNALRAAEGLTEGQDVVLQWNGATKGEAQRIVAILPATPQAKRSKQFTMRAEFVNYKGRSITFSIPMTADLRESLKEYEVNGWVHVTSGVDERNQATEVAAIRPLSRRPTAGS